MRRRSAIPNTSEAREIANSVRKSSRHNRWRAEFKNAIFKPSTSSQVFEEDLKKFSVDFVKLKIDHPELGCEENFEKTMQDNMLKEDFTKLSKFEKLIIEFLHNEKCHLKKLRVLDCLYFDYFKKHSTSTTTGFDVKTNNSRSVFQNIPDIKDLIKLHKSLIFLLETAIHEELHLTDPTTTLTKKNFKDLKFSEVIKTWLIPVLVSDSKTGNYRPRAIFRENSIQLCNSRKPINSTVRALVEVCPEFKENMNYLEDSALTNLSFDSILSAQTQRITRYSFFIKQILNCLNSESEEDKKERRQLSVIVLAFDNLCLMVGSDLKLNESKQNLIEMFNRLNYESILNCPECQKEWTEIGKIPKVQDLKLFSVMKLITLPDLIEIECHCYLFQKQVLLVRKDKNGDFSGLNENFSIKTAKKLKNSKSSKTEKYNYFPVLKIDESILISENPLNNNGFYLVNQSKTKNQIYEFKTSSLREKREWIEKLEEAKENNNNSTDWRISRKRLSSDIQREEEIKSLIRGCSLKDDDKKEMIHFIRNLTGVSESDSGVFE